MIHTLLTYWNEHRWLIIAGFTGIMLSVILFGNIVPLFVESGYLGRQIRTQQKRIEQADEWEATGRYVRDRKKRLENEISRFVVSRGQDTHISRIVRFLSDEAEKQDIRMTSIKPGPAQDAGHHVIFPVELAFSADYHRTGRFIHHIEISDQMVKVASLDMASPDMTASRLNVKVTLSFCYLKGI